MVIFIAIFTAVYIFAMLQISDEVKDGKGFLMLIATGIYGAILVKALIA